MKFVDDDDDDDDNDDTQGTLKLRYMKLRERNQRYKHAGMETARHGISGKSRVW